MPTKEGISVMPVDPKLRRRIRVLLAERDMDQKELAARTSMSASTISNFLSGYSNDVKLSTLESIARALNCTVEILFENIQPDN